MLDMSCVCVYSAPGPHATRAAHVFREGETADSPTSHDVPNFSLWFFFSAVASTAACRSGCANGVEIHVWEKVCPLVPPSSNA
jgi:hypothetical protein